MPRPHHILALALSAALGCGSGKKAPALTVDVSAIDATLTRKLMIDVPTGSTSKRPSEKIRNISAVQRPTPRTGTSLAMTSSSGRPGSSSSGTIR